MCTIGLGRASLAPAHNLIYLEGGGTKRNELNIKIRRKLEQSIGDAVKSLNVRSARAKCECDSFSRPHVATPPYRMNIASRRA